MNFAKYYTSLDKYSKTQLADDAKTSTDYLYQIATNRRRAGFPTIRKLIAADNNITITMFDPDIET